MFLQINQLQSCYNLKILGFISKNKLRLPFKHLEITQNLDLGPYGKKRGNLVYTFNIKGSNFLKSFPLQSMGEKVQPKSSVVLNFFLEVSWSCRSAWWQYLPCSYLVTCYISQSSLSFALLFQECYWDRKNGNVCSETKRGNKSWISFFQVGTFSQALIKRIWFVQWPSRQYLKNQRTATQTNDFFFFLVYQITFI